MACGTRNSRNQRAQRFVFRRRGAPVRGNTAAGVLPVTCGQGPGDSEPRRLVGLANIIGNLTNILPALRLCHIIQGQHLRIRAINPRVLEQTNNMESHGRGRQQQRPEHRQCRSIGIGPAGAGVLPRYPGSQEEGAAMGL